MVKVCLFGFIAYSGILLTLLCSPVAGALAGPLPAVILGAFWWPYAFVAAAMLLYNFDLPVGRLLGPPARLQRLLMHRMADAAKRP